jgi:hypothetical protein
MPTLTSTSIRLDVIARLIAASTSAGSRVTDSKTTPDQKDDVLPRMAVYTANATSVDRSRGIGIPRFQRREEISVEAVADADNDAALAALLDTLETEILAALLTNGDFVLQFEGIGDIQTAKGRNAEGDRRRGSVRVSLTALYTTVFEPATVTDDLNTVQFEVDVDGDGEINPPTGPGVDLTSTLDGLGP